MALDLNALVVKWTDKVKKWRNSFRIPPLLSWAISKDGKIDPTIKETLADAPPASTNWVRIGLGKDLFGPIKVWHILVLPILMYALKFGKEALQFFIEFSFQLIAVSILVVIGYFIWKSLKK